MTTEQYKKDDVLAYLRSVQQVENVPPEFSIMKKSITVGRHPSNDLALPFPSVSRHHCRIDFEEGGFILSDLGSSNGTFVNSRRVGRLALNDGDIVTFGNLEMQFYLASHLAEEYLKKNKPDTMVDMITPRFPEQSRIRSSLTIEPSPLPGSDMDHLKREDLILAHGRLASLYKLSDILRSVSNDKEMLHRVMNLVFDVLPADRGAVLLASSKPGEPLQAVEIRQRHTIDPPIEIAISKTIVDRCMDERLALLSSDALRDERFKDSDSILKHDIRSTMCVPLVVQNRAIGVIYIDTHENIQAFTEEDLAFLTSIANELAVSLEHLRLHDKVIQNERMAAIGETIMNVAHNIKNMLLLSKGGFDLLESQIESGSLKAIRENWGITKHGIERISNLAKDMLEFSRKHSIQIKEGDLNKLIRDICSSMEDECNKKHINICLNLDPRITTRLMDTEGIHRALANLIVNSIQAINHDEGEITIQTELASNGDVIIIVNDNGCGIKKEYISKIFSPFFTTKGIAGTGLGLSTTKKIIDEMGGAITVISEENHGALFTISLPLMDTQAGDL